MDGHSPNANVCGRLESLLVDWNLFKIIQCIPAINHSETNIQNHVMMYSKEKKWTVQSCHCIYISHFHVHVLLVPGFVYTDYYSD